MTSHNYNKTTSIDVSVILNETDNSFSYFNNNGEQSKGNVVVTQPNTLVNYKLVCNSNNLTFDYPELSPLSSEGTLIDDGNLDDITVSISADKQVMTVIDADLTNEQIGINLVVIKDGTKIISPDPRIVNKIEPQL